MPPQENTTSPDLRAPSKGARQRSGDAFRVITHIVGKRELQATRAQQLYEFGQVLVSALAREDFVANDDDAKGCGHADIKIRRKVHGGSSALPEAASSVPKAGGGPGQGFGCELAGNRCDGLLRQRVRRKRVIFLSELLQRRQRVVRKPER